MGPSKTTAVAGSFFNLSKRERTRSRSYKTRAGARHNNFDYFEMFYNPKRNHVRNEILCPQRAAENEN